MDTGGMVDVDRVADAFHMSKGQLAETAGLGVATVSKADRRTSPRAQMRVTEMLEIISRIREWAGGEAQAMAWYRSQPIPALDGRTPERSEEHTSELQSLMRISYAVFCLKKKKNTQTQLYKKSNTQAYVDTTPST